MQVAEERHEAIVGVAVHQYAHVARLADALGCHVIAGLVEGAEILAVDEGVRRILARQHRVGLRPRGDQDGAGRERRLDRDAVLLACHLERPGLPCLVDLDRHG